MQVVDVKFLNCKRRSHPIREQYAANQEENGPAEEQVNLVEAGVQFISKTPAVVRSQDP